MDLFIEAKVSVGWSNQESQRQINPASHRDSIHSRYDRQAVTGLATMSLSVPQGWVRFGSPKECQILVRSIP